MQKFQHQLNETDRRVARNWRLAAVGFYGSILAGMLVYAALHGNPELNYASAESAARGKVMAAPEAKGRAPVSP